MSRPLFLARKIHFYSIFHLLRHEREQNETTLPAQNASVAPAEMQTHRVWHHRFHGDSKRHHLTNRIFIKSPNDHWVLTVSFYRPMRSLRGSMHTKRHQHTLAQGQSRVQEPAPLSVWVCLGFSPTPPPNTLFGLPPLA